MTTTTHSHKHWTDKGGSRQVSPAGLQYYPQTHRPTGRGVRTLLCPLNNLFALKSFTHKRLLTSNKLAPALLRQAIDASSPALFAGGAWRFRVSFGHWCPEADGAHFYQCSHEP